MTEHGDEDDGDPLITIGGAGAPEGCVRVRVDDHGVQRPFMLGRLVHSLTESGLSFEAAYGVAREV